MGEKKITNNFLQKFINMNTSLKSTSLALPRISRSINNRSLNLAVALTLIASEFKCDDIILLDMNSLTNWTSYACIVTTFNRPQTVAVLSEMKNKAMTNFGRKTNSNLTSSEWDLLDFGDVVVNIMSSNNRQFYDLESFYGMASEVAIEELI